MSTVFKDLKAVFFDLDNTLFSWDDGNHAALELCYEIMNKQIPMERDVFKDLHDSSRLEFANELANQAASHNRVHFFKRMIEKHTGSTNPELTLELFDNYWKRFFEAMTPHPQAKEVLEHLHQQGLPLTLLSNHTSDIQLRKVEKLGISKYFTHFLFSEELGIEKPDPRVFQIALDKNKVQPEEVVMIGDSWKNDIASALNLGIRSIHTIEYSTREESKHVKSESCILIKQLSEVINLIT